jgi:selenophosphate synthase
MKVLKSRHMHAKYIKALFIQKSVIRNFAIIRLLVSTHFARRKKFMLSYLVISKTLIIPNSKEKLALKL